MRYTVPVENIALKDYTTLKLGGKARYFFITKNEEDIVSAVDFALSRNLPIFPLGGGSNVVVSDEVAPIVCIKLENKGIEITEDIVTASSGETWDDFVDFAVTNNLSGIEALSAIPGTVGASPIQNIGAYGAEVSQTIISVRGYNIFTKKFEILSNADCKFGYRTSIFKNELKNKFIIESVTFKLSKKTPKIPDYPLVAETISEFPEVSLLVRIRKAIQKIRASKLPDPKKIQNVGSFFKNVFVDEKTYQKILKKYPDLPNFKSENKYKIPSGWLIEKAGYKGYQKNGVGVYEKNALVLVNFSSERTKNLLSLAKKIQNDVREKFGLELQIEPEIVS